MSNVYDSFFTDNFMIVLCFLPLKILILKQMAPAPSFSFPLRIQNWNSWKLLWKNSINESGVIHWAYDWKYVQKSISWYVSIGSIWLLERRLIINCYCSLIHRDLELISMTYLINIRQMSWQTHTLNHGQTIHPTENFTQFVQNSLSFNMGIIVF